MIKKLVIKKVEELKKDTMDRFKSILWHTKTMLENLEDNNAYPPLGDIETLMALIASSAGELTGICKVLYEIKKMEIPNIEDKGHSQEDTMANIFWDIDD